MDREAAAAGFRRLYALVQRCGAEDRAAILPALGDVAQATLGPSFRFEPDMQRVTDVTPARVSALRPVAAASKSTLSVIPGGASSDERPSSRFIEDDGADDAHRAG